MNDDIARRDAVPGTPTTTYTMMARCERTGQVGLCATTSSFAVGARVPRVRARTGAVAIMAVADAGLGHLAMRLLEAGYRAQAVVEELTKADQPFAEYRQFGVVDGDGRVAVRTGTDTYPWSGHRADSGYIALGNNLVGPEVVEAMEAAFLSDEQEDLPERLLRAVEAGRAAGGERDAQNSAALITASDHAFADVDLRVDVHDEPLLELRRVWDRFRPTVPYYRMRQIDPARAEEWERAHADVLPYALPGEP